MPKYVDGFVIPVPEKNLKAYTRMASQAAAVWREHGALEYRESVGEDLSPPFAQPFPRVSGPAGVRRLSSRGSCTAPALIATR